MKKYMRMIIPGCQLVAAYIVLHLFRRDLLKQNLWTVGEKITEARDNGLHFFNYIRKTHPEINIYYIITEGTVDEKKLPTERVVHFGTFKHKLYCMAAVNCIGGQAHGCRPYAKCSSIRHIYEPLKRKGQKLIWIGHGVRKDKILSFSHLYTRYSLLTVGTQTEYDYYRKEFSIPEEKIAATGLCRFDALHEFETKRQILVMPTFRSWLRPQDSTKDEVSKSEAEKFVESPFFRSYLELLGNKSLQSLLKERNIQLIFYMHYVFQPYRTLFSGVNHPNIVIAGRNDYDVQALLKESQLLVTDYSSVFFDFCYMKKRVIYYQFDQEEYRSRHYKEGYWSYERDGFGPVLKESQDVVDEIARAVECNFALSPVYKEKADKFFVPYDTDNCKRLYEAIINLKD